MLGKFILEMAWGFLEIRGEKKYWWDSDIWWGTNFWWCYDLFGWMKWRDEEWDLFVEIEVLWENWEQEFGWRRIEGLICENWVVRFRLCVWCCDWNKEMFWNVVWYLCGDIVKRLVVSGFVRINIMVVSEIEWVSRV